MATYGLLGRVREVGRPQAPFLSRRPVPGSSVRTVLYAPTWEGWGDEEFSSSLQHGGVELVRRILATPAVRLAYRPHPLTGSRDRSTRRAHQQVLALLAAAGAAVATPTSTADTVPDGDDRLDDLALMLSRCRTGASTPGAGTPELEARTDPAERLWADAGRPLVSSGDHPSLLSCFAHSDLLVADVSSIVTDWLALDRPYAVLVPPNEPYEVFTHSHPTAAAGALIGPDCSGLDDLLADLAQDRDPCSAQRRALREDLLGSPPETAQHRFDAALRDLVGVAVAGGTASSARSARKEPA